MSDSGEGERRNLPFHPATRSIGTEALSGVTWLGSTKLLRHGLHYLLQIVLARILFPSDFGLFGVVLIFIELGVFLNELGITAALIQRRELRREDTDTAFWGMLAFGVVLFAVMCAAAAPIAAFFDQPRLRVLLPIGGLTYMFASVGAVPAALLSRDMLFRRLMIPEVGGVLVGNAVAIGLALSGSGAVSLVWGQVGTAAAVSALALIAARFRPRLRFRWECMRSLFSFGGYIVGRRLVDYAAAGVVYFIIATVLGDTVAGLYLIISRVSGLPQYAFSSVFGRVALSAFSRIQDEDERINRGFLLMTRYTVLFSTPILCVLALLAREFLVVVYGPKWLDGAAPLAVLAFVGLINAAESQPGAVWLAKGRASLPFHWAILMAVTLVLAGLAGIPWGLMGVAVALTVRSLLLFPITPLITRRVSGLDPRDYYRVLWPYLVAGGIVCGVLQALWWAPFIPWPERPWSFLSPDLVRLAVLSIVGTIIYAVAVEQLRPETRDEIRGLVRRLRAGDNDDSLSR